MHKTWMVILTACAVSGTAIAADTPDVGHPGWDRAAMQKRHADIEAKRADDMAVLIGLRADQRPALDRFLQSTRPSWGRPGADGAPRQARGPEAEGSFADRLDAMQASADRRDAAIKQKIDATRQFYAGLTPDQQHRFDALEQLRHGHERGFGRSGFHGPDTPRPPSSAG